MLVIISDLHLTDGTSGETIAAGAFRAFRERLRDLAYDASWRDNGKYEPIRELDLILLGDILDVIRSTSWLDAKRPRPWDDPTKPGFIKRVAAISDTILQSNAESLAVLKSLDDGKTTTLPPATREGKPAKVSRDPEAKERVPVKVRIHYMVGNHDWFYHLPGAAYNRIRERVVEAMGLVNPANQPFPHDPAESRAITSVFRAHQVFARHGDIYDGFNYEGNRDNSSLGDAIVVELLNRFPAEVERRIGAELPKECVSGLREIDNVRPLQVVPAWIDGLLRRTCTGKDAPKQDRVKKIWDELADEFLRLPFVRDRDQPFRWDRVDTLEMLLKFSRSAPLNVLSRLLTRGADRLASRREPDYQDAVTEDAFKEGTARFIVYGHTHHPETIPLDVQMVSGKPLKQMYLNSGTWRRVHELAQLNVKELEFMGYHVMTYLAFFKDGERKGRPFEVWSGQLGV